MVFHQAGTYIYTVLMHTAPLIAKCQGSCLSKVRRGGHVTAGLFYKQEYCMAILLQVGDTVQMILSLGGGVLYSWTTPFRPLVPVVRLTQPASVMITAPGSMVGSQEVYLYVVCCFIWIACNIAEAAGRCDSVRGCGQWHCNTKAYAGRCPFLELSPHWPSFTEISMSRTYE